MIKDLIVPSRGIRLDNEHSEDPYLPTKPTIAFDDHACPDQENISHSNAASAERRWRSNETSMVQPVLGLRWPARDVTTMPSIARI